MEQSPKNVTVLDGKDATIVCRAVGAPAPNITWMYNGKMIRDSAMYSQSSMNLIDFAESIPIEISGRVQILESGDLLISNVRESDAGLYTCTRSNEAGTVTGEAYLGVMGKNKLKIYSMPEKRLIEFVHRQFELKSFNRQPTPEFCSV